MMNISTDEDLLDLKEYKRNKLKYDPLKLIISISLVSGSTKMGITG